MLSTTTRLSNLNAREKRFVVGGTLIALLLLAFLLWPSGEADQSNVELVPADQRGGGAPAAAPPPAAVTPPPVFAAPVAPPAAPAAAGAGSPEGLRLHGVTGSGAIIGFPDGSQRYVALGRDVLPGLRLQAVRVHHALLAAAATNYRLGFSGPASVIGPPAAAPAPVAGPSVAITNPAEARRTSAERAQTAQYLQILSPRMENGRTSGYTIRPGAAAAPLEQAGLRAGDTILSVNGTPLGPEQLQELAWTLNNSTRTEFIVERGGQRLNFTYAPGR
jgi:hypothetical protein